MPKTSLDIPEGGGGVAVTVYKDQGEHFWQVYLNTFSDCIHWKGLWYNVVVGKSILPNGWMDGWTDRWNILNEPLCLFFVFFLLPEDTLKMKTILQGEQGKKPLHWLKNTWKLYILTHFL